MNSSAPSIAARIQRYAPTELKADLSTLSAGDRLALDKLVQAAKIFDTLYLSQAWSGNEALRAKLAKDATPAGIERLRYFDLNMGPWSTLDHDAPFIDGVPPKPPGANLYPEDMTKTEFETWAKSLDSVQRENATGFFYAVRRNPAGSLILVSYAQEYAALLAPAGKLLREAAATTTNASLKKFLIARADAFSSNDYFASDVAWMDLDAPIEPTIGPYEVYMDELFNYKAAFEAYITIRNDAETKKLAMFADHLQEVEDHLPIDPKYRNPKLGASAPIRVVDEVMVGGEARSGVQTAAFNLPNDERVIQQKGSKRVMLKNVQEAKFNNVLRPVAAVALGAAQRNQIAFEQFFTHILAHELMHGLGPHSITVAGRQTTARQEMKELSSALEEAKADIAGLFALQFMMEKGILDKSSEASLYITYLASAFRSVRFGVNDAHGKGQALQFNFLVDEGAFLFDQASGTFSVDVRKMKEGVKKLTGIIMTLQAEGNYWGAKELLDRYGVILPPMQSVLDKLTSVPTDIAPTFPVAAGLN